MIDHFTVEIYEHVCLSLCTACKSVCVRFALQHLDLLILHNIWHDRTDAWSHWQKYRTISLGLLSITPMLDASNHGKDGMKEMLYDL